jgi:anti-sigma-K factor RskA
VSEIHSGVGSYVIDALDSDEREEFQAHLAVCETCSREVIEFSETAAELSLLADTKPPPALRLSVLAAIREVRPLPPEAPESATEIGPVRDSNLPVQATTPPPAAVDELALRRQRRLSRVLTLAVAAALVVALALGGWVYSLVQQRESQVAQATAQSQLFSAPDAKVYTSALPGGRPVSYVVSKSLNKAMFVGPDVPAAGPGKKYQLWTIDLNQTPRPDTLFNGGKGRQEWFTGNLRDAAALAVTVEPSSGSATPTSPVLAAVNL